MKKEMYYIDGLNFFLRFTVLICSESKSAPAGKGTLILINFSFIYYYFLQIYL